jgi:hypothetical protein
MIEITTTTTIANLNSAYIVPAIVLSPSCNTLTFITTLLGGAILIPVLQ